MSGSGAFETCTAPLLVYMSLFLISTHESLALFTLFLEVLPSMDFAMTHLVLVHVQEVLSPSILADHVFLIAVLAPNMLMLSFMHLLFLFQCG